MHTLRPHSPHSVSRLPGEEEQLPAGSPAHLPELGCGSRPQDTLMSGPSRRDGLRKTERFPSVGSRPRMCNWAPFVTTQQSTAGRRLEGRPGRQPGSLQTRGAGRGGDLLGLWLPARALPRAGRNLPAHRFPCSCFPASFSHRGLKAAKPSLLHSRCTRGGSSSLTWTRCPGGSTRPGPAPHVSFPLILAPQHLERTLGCAARLLRRESGGLGFSPQCSGPLSVLIVRCFSRARCRSGR